MSKNLKQMMKELKPQSAELKRKVKAELWRRNCLEFIEEAIKIEDRDAVGLAIPFRLWPAQANVVSTFLTERLTIVLKARQLGLTWLALAYAVWNMVFTSGFSAIALSKREVDAKELVRRVEFILRYLPDWMIREKKDKPKGWKGLLWSSTSLSVTIEHHKQEAAWFQSLTASRDSGRSFTASLVILDEWAFQPFAEDIYTAAYPSINRPDGGQVIGLSTGRRGTFFEKMWNGSINKENSFVPIFLSWRADPRRNDQWHEKTKTDLPTTFRAEYPETMDDAFTVGEGAFFPQWDPDFHIVDEPGWYPPPECQIHCAYDPGYGSRACFKWYAVFPGRPTVIVGYREYYPHQVSDPEQAKTIVEMSKDPHGVPENILSIRADPSAWNKQSGTGQSTAEIFSEHGLTLLRGDNDLSNGWRRLHQWLAIRYDEEGNKLPPLLRFTRGCANTIRTYPACEQSVTNPEDISNKSEHHAQDTDRYLIMGRPEMSDSNFIFSGHYRGKYDERIDFDEEDYRDEMEDAGDFGELTFYS